VVQSDEEFEFVPVDGLCYDSRQLGCGSAGIEPLPEGLEVLAIGCELTCAADDTEACEEGADQCTSFLMPTGKKYFGIYARSALGRYSWGVAADSDGNVLDAGFVGEDDGSGGGGTDPGPTIPLGPAVTIAATPLEGSSPLEVDFKGNAVSELRVDESRTAWDFDVDDSITVNTNKRTTSHTYSAPAGQSKTFVARLTMVDIGDNEGSAEVAICVHGEQIIVGDDPAGTGELRIVVSIPGTSGSDVDSGVSPFEVLLSIDASGLTGTLLSVSWDLGDGGRATSLEVPHTYVNEGDTALRIPITATVTTQTSGGTTVSNVATRIITVEPGDPVVDPGDPDLPGTTPKGDGGAATPCSGVGLIPLLFCVVTLMWMRRRP
jgi:PKD repeat protein